MDYSNGITLVTVNYNSSKYIDDLIHSIKNGLEKCGSCFILEIIIVDNASNSDDYHQLVKLIDKHSCNRNLSIRVIRNKKNYGYAGGVNIGVRAASHDIIIVSNPDITFREDFFQRFSRLFRLLALPKSGYIIVPRILLKQARRVNSKGLRIHAAGYGLLRGLYGQEGGEHEKVEHVLSPHGALFISSRKILQDLGPFDISLCSFLEDLDLGIRAYLHGYQVVYVPYLVAYHDWGVSWGLKLSNIKYYLCERNRLILSIRELPGRFIVASLSFILLSELISLTYAVKAHYPHLKALVYADILKNLPKLLRERRMFRTKNYEMLTSILAKESTWRFEHTIFSGNDMLIVNTLYQGLSRITRFIWPWGD